MIAIPIIVCISILSAIAQYYYKVAKEHGKNKLGYGFLGFFMPLFPFILFVAFILNWHLILGHDPKFHLGKTLPVVGMLLYMIYVLYLPQRFKEKWSETEDSVDNSTPEMKI